MNVIIDYPHGKGNHAPRQEIADFEGNGERKATKNATKEQLFRAKLSKIARHDFGILTFGRLRMND